MSGRLIRKINSALVLVFIFLLFLNSNPVSGTGEYAVYTAPDGFKVVSYSSAWSDTAKLKAVYDELLRNTHGEEFKLLRKINIYPGSDPQGTSITGRWFGVWQTRNGEPVLSGNRYIEIYNGEKFTTVESISRTLAHEYGHHFTYYYFFKKEKKTWDGWKRSQFAVVRGLKNNSKVTTGSGEHQWLIEEIAAEDYVQFFGSPTCKSSVRFGDISQRMSETELNISFNTNMYNYRPQENYEIPLASNLPKLKQYWLSASGLTNKNGQPPTQINLELSSTTKANHSDNFQYAFAWNKSADDKTLNLEYTLVCFEKTNYGMLKIYPIKTVSGDEPMTAVFGVAENEAMYMREEVPTGLAYFVVYVKDSEGLITSSRVLAVDFSDRSNPQSVQIGDNSLLSGAWFPPRVKIINRQMNFDVPPVNKNGRILVPLRAIFENLGASVEWDAKTKTVTANRGTTNLSLQVSSKIALVNGQNIMLDVPAEITNGRMLVPLRFVSEALGAQVEWNQNLQLAAITQ